MRATQAHVNFITFLVFRKVIEPGSGFKPGTTLKCQKNIENLANLCMLYGLCNLINDLPECYATGYFERGVSYRRILDEAIKQLNLRIRPQALSILESVKVPDFELWSAIGNSYGDIYETHLDWAKDSRLNKTKLGDAIPDGYMEYMMPILKAKL